jgi:hypothetical protein
MHTQKDPKWDDTVSKDWPVECKEVEIISTIDEKIQNAYFYKSQGEKPRPLIVSLHLFEGGHEMLMDVALKNIN